jgi:hypothetical protein
MKIISKEFNIQTGEETITERNETAVEKKEREKFEAEISAVQEAAEAKATARQEVLAKLGLTADEAAILLG